MDFMGTGVYVITCTATGRQYVGSSANCFYDRWALHRSQLGKGIHHSRFLQRAWNKYGPEAFTFAVLEECPPAQCLEREQYWLDTMHPAFNSSPTAGSPLGLKHSAEARARMSAAHKAIPWKNPMKGRKHRPESLEKMSKAHKGIAPPTAGQPMSDETRAKLSASCKGRVPWNKGKPSPQRGVARPPEVREKIRQGQTASWERRLPVDPAAPKHCRDCDEWKPRSDFTRSVDRRDGLSPLCRVCSAARWAVYYTGRWGRKQTS